MRAVVEEAQRATAGSGVIYHFGYHGFILAEVEFVADTDFACRFDQHIPEFLLYIEFAEEEHFDTGAGLFLVAVKQGGKHFGVVEHHYIAVVEKVEDVAENVMRNLAGLAVYHHQTGIIALLVGVVCDEFVGKFEVKLRKLHLLDDEVVFR